MSMRLNVLPLIILGLVWTQIVSAVPQPGQEVITFRLDDTATFQEGCFDPCDCKLSNELEISGTFSFGPAIIGNAVDFHEITDICWRVIGDDGLLFHTITGSGVYRISNFGPPLHHDMHLDLSIDGGPPQFFFSDTVKVPANGTLNNVISINGIFCDDVVIRVNASPSKLTLGDVNLDGFVSLLDVAPLVDLINAGEFQSEADINRDCLVDLRDVQPFVELLIGG